MRKIGSSAKPRSPQTPSNRRTASRAEDRSQSPDLAGPRPPPPGRGMRGEQGYLAYLLRQAQAATRLTLERSLAGLGVTPPQFVVLTMLRAYPGLSGADLARLALLTPDRRRYHPQPGARRRHPKDPASGARAGAAVDADPPRRHAAGPMPAARQRPGTAVDGWVAPEGTAHGPALAVQNCRRPAAGCWFQRVMTFAATLPAPLDCRYETA